MIISTVFPRTCIFAIVSVMLASNEGYSAMAPKQTNAVISKMSEQEWQHLIKGERASRRQVAWRIKITDVSSFGGFYVKGHLSESNGFKVHLIWPPENAPSGTNRDILIVGGDVTIHGSIQGITTEKEVIISVNEYSRY